MNISKDYSYIKHSEKKLLDAGYGNLTVHSLHFSRYVSEEQKEANRKFYEGITIEKRNAYYKSEEFEKIQKAFGESLQNVLDIFIGKFDIHQVTEETSTMSHYCNNWDLYFWCDRGWNNKEYMTCFSLSFNENRIAEQNMELLDEIISILEEVENNDVYCRIQYDFYIDEAEVSEAARKAFEWVENKFVNYLGYNGKIKIVNNQNGKNEYGFFKRGARTKFFPINKIDLAAINL